MQPIRSPFAGKQSFVLSTLLFAMPGLFAQVPAPIPPPRPEVVEEVVAEQDAAPDKDVEAGAARSLLETLKQASEEERPKALREFVEDQVKTNALFAGQYSALKPIAGCDALIAEWISRPPTGLSDRSAFRTGCVRATRDIFETASPELVAKLKKIASSSYELANLRTEAVYALAQFGHREMIEARLAELTAATKGEDAERKAAAFQGLAELRYNLREFAVAGEIYENLFSWAEKDAFKIEESDKSLLFYNAACSHALAGNKEQALKRLEDAFLVWKAAGAIPVRLLRTDMDIHSLRETEAFQALMAKYLPPPPQKDGAANDKK